MAAVPTHASIDCSKMKKLALGLMAMAYLLAGCVAYVPQPGPAPKGGPGNNYCPPGQAKKGNC